jgi:hypothetical protein
VKDKKHEKHERLSVDDAVKNESSRIVATKSPSLGANR